MQDELQLWQDQQTQLIKEKGLNCPSLSLKIIHLRLLACNSQLKYSIQILMKKMSFERI
ncbi:unnamed protein product (macronuclear) [Paramecium tetraurelia]|uniref:Uncharacterized protein n=1 Tax=Paramecium tetraurelia TaxID=5888 RepID=A0DC48_PARTE|nr:uncharacterized protein GSPATT00015492001 [Paramecium tetraurelia]CAK80615.1 unnamed protein product [Paramecium tetraurelia]|eukprot:XP_001448012.1 hypothetical protein (macronuclear) [Paramecium tetraurelia strain d4-2]